MSTTQANPTWSAEDGQCVAFGCPMPRLFADPYCQGHRDGITAGGSLPVSKPPTIPRDDQWNRPLNRPAA